MSAFEFIRTQVFKLSQSAFAERTGMQQSVVSRLKSGELPLNEERMRKIRDAALEDGLTFEGQPWNDSWFFEPPVVNETQV